MTLGRADVGAAEVAPRLASETTVAAMSGRYNQGDLNTYGAEDDQEMDVILEALERAATEATPLSSDPPS